jgi:hypothetical protein
MKRADCIIALLFGAVGIDVPLWLLHGTTFGVCVALMWAFLSGAACVLAGSAWGARR